MGPEGQTRQTQLGNISSILARDFTCVKVETVTVNSTAVKLNPPSDKQIYYAVIQPTTDGGAASAQALIRISESQAYPASTSLGIILGLYDIYDIKGNNNIQGFSMCSLNAVDNTITVSYYTI